MTNVSHKIRDILESAVSKKVFPGAVVGFFKNDFPPEILSAGRFRYQENSPKVETKTIFDTASLTKSVVTTTLVWGLIDQEVLSLDSKIKDFIPELNLKMVGESQEKNLAFNQNLNLKQLLAYTLPLDVQLSVLKDQSAEIIWQEVVNSKLGEFPDGNPLFINSTSLLLSVLVERASGQSLKSLAEDLIFKPLKMDQTYFGVSELAPSLKSKVVPTEIDGWRGREIQGEVHDESAWTLFKQGRSTGAAGMFSTVPDLLKFCKYWLDQENRDLGWEQAKPWMASASIIKKYPQLFGKTGFTGCSIVMEPETKTAIVLLSNTIYPERPKVRDQINGVRRQVTECILGQS